MVELVEMEKQERIVAGGLSSLPERSAVEMVEDQRPTARSLRNQRVLYSHPAPRTS